MSKSAKTRSRSVTKSRSSKKSRGTRTAATSPDTMRIAASAMIPGDLFVMNGQRPAVVMDNRTWTSNTSGEAFTNTVIRRNDGGVMAKSFDPAQKVLVMRNEKLDTSRKAVSSANMITV